MPLIGLVNPVKYRPGAAAGARPPWARGRPEPSRTPRCPTSPSRPRRYPVAAITASGAMRVPSASRTLPSSKPSIAATTSTRPERTASIRPTSCTGMAPSATRL
ncbi:hypothetical protein STENM327S_02658 [Streptomyces tendae]